MGTAWNRCSTTQSWEQDRFVRMGSAHTSGILKGIYVNLNVPSRAIWRQGNARVTLTQQTTYPNTGDTTLVLNSDPTERFAIALQYLAGQANEQSFASMESLRDHHTEA